MTVLRRTIFLFTAGAFLALGVFVVNVQDAAAQFDLQGCYDDVDAAVVICYDVCDDQLTDDYDECDLLLSNPINWEACNADAGLQRDECNDECYDEQVEDLNACADVALDLGAPNGPTPAEALTGGPETLGEQFDDIQSQGIIFAGICASRTSPCDCRDEGRCTLQDILQVMVNLSVFILGISGSIMLLIFFYGGFVWITAHGNPAMIDSGKKAITGAVIGLAIIFGAYAAVTLLVKVLTQGEVPAPGETLEEVIDAGDIFETQ